MSKPIDVERLRSAALALRAAIQAQMPSDPYVQQFFRALEPWLQRAEAGKISTAVELNEAPNPYRFLDDGLQGYGALEEAYAEFNGLLTGADDETLEFLRGLGLS
ncbi:hypothetical protein [Caulobacter endophyticus]|uniref:Uncharacterized protein n=1 Tax=Caulobacter endophyticus TaxID=2172652 RepID=A0A2T9JJE5_9CAUL|nr:hypothetical protein [Caulobacter endophyticus]PVM83804.1 hypothetical protein DDF67_20245 [Caulobacter endophyticus]